MIKTETKNYPNPILWKSNTRPFNMADLTGAKLPIHGIIKAGTIISNDAPAMYKSGSTYAVWTASATGTMNKEHSFGVGDAIFDGASGLTISAIDTSNALYDTFTLSGVATFTLGEVVYNTNAGAQGAELSVVTENTRFDILTATLAKVAITVTDSCIMDLNQLPNYSALATNKEMIKTVDV